MNITATVGNAWQDIFLLFACRQRCIFMLACNQAGNNDTQLVAINHTIKVQSGDNFLTAV